MRAGRKRLNVAQVARYRLPSACVVSRARNYGVQLATPNPFVSARHDTITMCPCLSMLWLESASTRWIEAWCLEAAPVLLGRAALEAELLGNGQDN